MAKIDLPKIKKELKHFLSDERGGITKKSVIKMGIALGGLMSLSENVSAHHVESYSHGNSLSESFTSPSATGQHGHSAIHSDGC